MIDTAFSYWRALIWNADTAFLLGGSEVFYLCDFISLQQVGLHNYIGFYRCAYSYLRSNLPQGFVYAEERFVLNSIFKFFFWECTKDNDD